MLDNILEKAVYTQVNEYLASVSIWILSKCLNKYMAGLFYLTDYITGRIGSGNYAGMIVIDVQKACDCVNHDILCKKLAIMGIDSSWFK